MMPLQLAVCVAVANSAIVLFRKPGGAHRNGTHPRNLCHLRCNDVCHRACIPTLVRAKREKPRRSIRRLIRMLERAKVVRRGELSKATVHRSKYLNNIVEQDHRPVKGKMKAMMGFKTFRTARITIGGIELVHMLRKGQMRSPDGEKTSWVEQFFSLAFAT